MLAGSFRSIHDQPTGGTGRLMAARRGPVTDGLARVIQAGAVTARLPAALSRILPAQIGGAQHRVETGILLDMPDEQTRCRHVGIKTSAARRIVGAVLQKVEFTR